MATSFMPSARRSGLTAVHPATTRMVDRLKERGWVRRESPRGNRRTINVIITLDGRRAYVRNNRTFTVAVEQAVSARLSNDEQATLTSLHGRVGTGPPARQASGRSPLDGVTT